ncbi:unnamed protein product [Strongylus vulgaris]|uniref:Uncharacterized protein n=1 Tax=Strongylus vulgaris TaxID=40348 RepID=A0A3P7J4V8_STRVU|nr:unnamed protein product [Strongylus vulgaris]
MALIYANAVNKRMNNPISKPKKKHTPPCVFLDDSSAGIARDGRKRSTSRETTPLRKTSCNIPPHLQANHSNAEAAFGTQAPCHRPVQRSKTSCGEMSNKDHDDDDTPRKTSHPAISQSATSDALCGKRAQDKRALAKKSLIQKYNLEHGYDDTVRNPNAEERRRSISLDPDQWFEQVTGQGDK